jgi:cytochrome c551/c552
MEESMKIFVKASLISTLSALGLAAMLFIGTATGQDEELPKGIGPIQELELAEELDPALAEQGKTTFEQFCTACHKFDQRYVGPALQGVTTRRAPEWIMNMILVPDKMIQEDETAYNLFAEFMAPMANQNMTEEQARAILEYFRTVDAEAAETE